MGAGVDISGRVDHQVYKCWSSVLRLVPNHFMHQAPMIRTCGVLGFLVLTACGGGQNGSSEMAPVAKPSSVITEVMFVGDSTFAEGSVMPARIPKTSTPQHYEKISGLPVTNLAVPRSVACEAPLDRIKARPSSGVKVVVVNYGLNEAYGAGGRPRYSLEAYARCLEDIGVAAAESGSILVWSQANPIYNETIWTKDWDETIIQSYDRAKMGVSGYYCSQPAINWRTVDMLYDGIHPTDNATPAIAAKLVECVNAAVNP